MKVSDAYPSNFVSAGDLDGRPVTLTIDRVADPNTVQREDGQRIDKAVLYFKEAKRGMIVGKTNARLIRIIHGNDMAKWIGKQITIYPTTIDMKLAAAEHSGCIILAVHGKIATVPTIRVSMEAAGISSEPPDLEN